MAAWLAVDQATLRLPGPELHRGHGPAAAHARAAAGVTTTPLVRRRA
ncbi:hypothetical protein ABR737_35590 [Streptomyces sp. Edi2]